MRTMRKNKKDMKKKTFVQERNGDLLPDEGLLVYYSARNLPCIRREAPGEVPVGVKVLNSCIIFSFSADSQP